MATKKSDTLFRPSLTSRIHDTIVQCAGSAIRYTLNPPEPICLVQAYYGIQVAAACALAAHYAGKSFEGHASHAVENSPLPNLEFTVTAKGSIVFPAKMKVFTVPTNEAEQAAVDTVKQWFNDAAHIVFEFNAMINVFTFINKNCRTMAEASWVWPELPSLLKLVDGIPSSYLDRALTTRLPSDCPRMSSDLKALLPIATRRLALTQLLTPGETAHDVAITAWTHSAPNYQF